MVVEAEAEAAMPAQRKDKAHPEIAAKLQLAPTKDKVVPANMVTVVEPAVVVEAGAVATEAQCPAAIKVVLPVCMVAVQEPGKIRRAVLLAEPTVHTIPAALQ